LGEVYTSTFAQTVLNLHRKVFEFLHFVKRMNEVAAVQRHVATNRIQYRGTQYAVMRRSFLTIKYVVVRCTTHVLIVPIVDIDDDCSTVQTKMGATISAKHGRTGTCSASECTLSKKITLTVMLEGNSAVRTRAVIHGVQGRQRYFNQVSTPCLLLLFLNFQSMQHMLLGTSCHVVGKTCRGNSVK